MNRRDDQLILRINNDAPIDLGQQDAFRPKSVRAKLHKGLNTVFVKLSNTRGSDHGGWVFNLRATAPDGTILIPKAPTEAKTN